MKFNKKMNKINKIMINFMIVEIDFLIVELKKVQMKMTSQIQILNYHFSIKKQN